MGKKRQIHLFLPHDIRTDSVILFILILVQSMKELKVPDIDPFQLTDQVIFILIVQTVIQSRKKPGRHLRNLSFLLWLHQFSKPGILHIVCIGQEQIHIFSVSLKIQVIGQKLLKIRAIAQIDLIAVLDLAVQTEHPAS